MSNQERGLYEGFSSVVDAAEGYAMEPELLLDHPMAILGLSRLLSDLLDIIHENG